MVYIFKYCFVYYHYLVNKSCIYKSCLLLRHDHNHQLIRQSMYSLRDSVIVNKIGRVARIDRKYAQNTRNTEVT